jgi:hypothetical protein
MNSIRFGETYLFPGMTSEQANHLKASFAGSPIAYTQGFWTPSGNNQPAGRYFILGSDAVMANALLERFGNQGAKAFLEASSKSPTALTINLNG